MGDRAQSVVQDLVPDLERRDETLGVDGEQKVLARTEAEVLLVHGRLRVLGDVRAVGEVGTIPDDLLGVDVGLDVLALRLEERGEVPDRGLRQILRFGAELDRHLDRVVRIHGLPFFVPHDWVEASDVDRRVRRHQSGEQRGDTWVVVRA